MKQGARLLEQLVRIVPSEKLPRHGLQLKGARIFFSTKTRITLAIDGVVCVPGRRGGIHDHAHVWTAYGILDGTETLQRFRRMTGKNASVFRQLTASVRAPNPYLTTGDYMSEDNKARIREFIDRVLTAGTFKDTTGSGRETGKVAYLGL